MAVAAVASGVDKDVAFVVTAGQAWINTLTATCVASLGWLGVDRIRDRHATGLGAASGVVAGLVAIPPAAGARRHHRRQRCCWRPRCSCDQR